MDRKSTKSEKKWSFAKLGTFGSSWVYHRIAKMTVGLHKDVTKSGSGYLELSIKYLDFFQYSKQRR